MRTEHIRRVASVGDIGWRLCERFHAVQWGPVAFLVVALRAAAAAVSWIAVFGAGPSSAVPSLGT